MLPYGGRCPDRSILPEVAGIPSSMANHINTLGVTATLLAVLHVAPMRAQTPFDSSTWDIRAAEWRVAPYRGRSALFLRDGAAWLKGSQFQNGTIEFDIAFG